MRKLTTSLAEKIRSGMSRVRRMHRGSVLIIVVALLVMMALIGTAAISMARLDRYAARQQVTTVENEIIREAMLQRARNDAINALARDNTGTMDSPFIINNGVTLSRVDPYLSPRTPLSWLDPVAQAMTIPAPAGGDGTFSCIYTALTKATPQVGTAQFLSGYKPFESPWGIGSGTWGQCQYTDWNIDDPNAAGRLPQHWIPGSVTIQYSGTYPDQLMQNKTRVFPAFYGLYNLDNTGTYTVVLAGDADGDGITDCGMYRLTDTPIRGEHFYVGIKIVDNNSAINPQIAWSRDHDYDKDGNFVANFGMFGGNVGFQEMLVDQAKVTGVAPDYDPATETKLNTPNTQLMAQYNNYRFNTGTTYLGASAVPIHVPDMVNNNAVARNDFNFDSQVEAKDSGLDRRLKTPTYNRDSNGDGTFEFYQSLPASDATAFSYKFNFVNPSGSPGQLAQFLPNSLLYSAPNFTVDPSKAWRFYPANPMDPTNVYNAWWNEMDFSATGGGKYKITDTKPRSIRQFLATLNPTLDGPAVRQTAIFDWNADGTVDAKDPPYPGMLPYTITNAGTWASGGTYRVDNIVKDNDTNAPYFSYIAAWALPASGNVPPGTEPFTGANMVAAPDYWEYQPYVTGNAPTSVNTATFRELFRSFYSVMAEGATNNNIPQTIYSDFFTHLSADNGSAPPDPFNPDLALQYYDPFLGRSFNPTDTTYFEPKRIGGVPNNTIPYEESYLRMFSSPIRDVRGGKDSPLGTTTPVFFNSTTNKSLRLNPSQVMALRSALASINLLGMRDQGILVGGVVVSNNVLSRTITLYDTPTTTAAAPPNTVPLPRFQATVFSTARQPYITEVLAYNVRNGADPAGYVAIELHNPYPIPLDISGWQIATLDRRNPRTLVLTPVSARFPTANTQGTGAPLNAPPDDFANMVYRPLTLGMGVTNPGIPSTPRTIIPANGYAILENYSQTAADTNKATARPALAEAKMAALPTYAIPVYVPNLHEVMTDATVASQTGSEFVLLRPRRGDGIPTKTSDWYGVATVPYDNFDEGSFPTNLRLSDWVPVDSFDFSGFELPAAGSTNPSSRLHYIRASHGLNEAFSDGAQWRCVYPGRYNGNEAYARQQGTEIASVTDITAEPIPARPITLGTGDLYSSFEVRLNTDPPNPNLDFPQAQNFTIPLCEIDWPGYNPLFNVATGVMEAQPFKWPYGGFGRIGDLLKVPYMGSYVLREVEKSDAGTFPQGMADPGKLLALRFLPPANYPNVLPPRTIAADEYLLEVNPITMDSVFAEDSAASGTANINEDVGRFCPKDPLTNPAAANYTWASDLFSYFTVTHNQADDYMPNFSPVQYWRLTGVYPQRVGNDGANPDTANEGGEDTVATQGLININTAPAEVLDMLPMVLDPTPGPNQGKVLEPDNRQLADAIVAHRSNTTATNKGPFKSLFDLNNVVDPAGTTKGFQNAWGHIDFTTPGSTDPGDSQGDYSPYDTPISPRTGMTAITTDGVRNDFEERYLQLARLSNLLTTRSDSFNVYVLVQSWKNVGAGATVPPMLTWEKRIAFTADRSALDPNTKARIIKTTDIPAD